MDRKRILIGEDDETILAMTKLRLEHEGYEVVTASDGETALQMARAAGSPPIHLVLLDVKMPALSGYDVCLALKQEPATARIPVIVFSASEPNQQRLVNRCIEIGAEDWLKKPFRAHELMAKIRRALEEQEGSEHG